VQVSAASQSSTEPAELARDLAAFFRYITIACNGPFLQEVAELDLSLGELKTLSLLYELPEGQEEPTELSVKEVAERLGISLPAASRALDPLVKRRLIARREDAEDRRVKRVRLTARGDALAARLMASRVASFEAVLQSFTDAEREKLAAAFAEVLTRPEIGRYRPRRRSR
jgi:DNA-binding MarR family transcriptional regulator